MCHHHQLAHPLCEHRCFHYLLPWKTAFRITDMSCRWDVENVPQAPLVKCIQTSLVMPLLGSRHRHYTRAQGCMHVIMCMRGNQKVLQLGYKKLTYYITDAVIFYIFSCNISAFFQLLFSAVYALKIEFSLLTLRPCLHSDLQWFIVYKSGSTKTVLQISY